MNSHTKHHLALGAIALACAAGACAQSSVQIYGQVGAGMTYQQASGPTTKQSVTSLDDNLMWTSFIGFTGSEDLGGGMRALFRLESGLTPDNGGDGKTVGSGATASYKMFNRQSWVGLQWAGGTITLGRQFHALTDRVVRTLDVNRVGGLDVRVVPLALFGVNKYNGQDNRVDNSVKYRFNLLNVIEGGISYGADEKVRGSGMPSVAPVVGASYSADLAHVTSKYEIAGGYIHYDAPNGIRNGTFTPAKSLWSLGGNVRMGSFRPYLAYIDSRFDNATTGVAQRNKIVDAGLSWTPAATPFTVTMAYYCDKGTTLNGVSGRDGVKQTFVLSGFYALSKRTELYTAYYQNYFEDGYLLEPTNQAALGRSATQPRAQGLSAGMRVSF